MSQLDIKIGPKIKAFRRQLGLQANKLSEDLGISPSYLNLIEGGKRKIDGDLLLKICEKLNIELSQLTSKTDINLENTLSEILDDKLFEDLDILGPEVKDLVGTNPMGFVPTRSFTSGPKISRSSNNLSSSISDKVFSKLISVFDVNCESSILSFSQIFNSKSPSIFLFPPSIKFK